MAVRLRFGQVDDVVAARPLRLGGAVQVDDLDVGRQRLELGDVAATQRVTDEEDVPK